MLCVKQQGRANQDGEHQCSCRGIQVGTCCLFCLSRNGFIFFFFAVHIALNWFIEWLRMDVQAMTGSKRVDAEEFAAWGHSRCQHGVGHWEQEWMSAIFMQASDGTILDNR